MMKIKVIFFAILLSTSSFQYCYGWGAEGHSIVGRIAMKYLKDDVKQNILNILGGMPVDSACNWMDKMKSDRDYDFMRSWHYIDFAKEQEYVVTNNDNIVNRLILSYNELSHKNTLCDQQIRTDLYILLHLMGDLHMPLHTGYEDDLGGNKVMVQYDTLKTHNLHWFWDEDIIRLTGITDKDCVQFYTKTMQDSITQIDFVAWMKDSRSLLDGVYSFPDFTLSEAYLQKNKMVVEKQLLKAGLRLAFLLNKLFYSSAPIIDFKAITDTYKNGIMVTEAANNIGKKVTICTRIYSIRSTSTITQISVGDKYPNNPLTIIIFAKNYLKFAQPLDELFKEKNICVKGTIEVYKGKPQIIVEDPNDIIIL